MPGKKRNKDERRVTKRFTLVPEETTLSFLVEGDSLDVTDVDISENGIGFRTTSPLKIMVKMKYKDREEQRLANLVWVSRDEDNAMRYGFEFLPDQKV
ncbi:MAG: PilZ domain-containing protein [Planctomycetes bacterium]|nr:PilZ domain-containing protein [Planctomycetota bacterium]